MLFFLIFLPLICSFLIWVIPLENYKYYGFIVISHLYLLLFFVWSFFFFKVCFLQYVFFLNLGIWLSCGSILIDWEFRLDSLSIVMFGLVLIVSTVVHFFSLGYMRGESNLIRFFSLLSLFTFFMFFLIVSDNYLVLFLGWEGIGVCSFLLISFWQTRVLASKSALKAIILNRVGDSAFLAGISFLFCLFKSLNFGVLFSLISFFWNQKFVFFYFSCFYIEIISFCFFLAAVGKSAQLGLHGWLPEAMEGPTPVSALIHAATLVTAGVFLIIRSSFIFEYSPFILNLILFLGGLTAVFGSTVSCGQNDIKRIIAFSTTSQLGYMFFACGLSSYNIALFHLLNHGFFKALLFLCAGTVIFLMSHEQDVRKYGSLVRFTPFLYSAFLIGNLALTGFPFLAGFYSKEIIIEVAFGYFNINSYFIYWVSTLAAVLTAWYGLRSVYLTFLIDGNWFKVIIQDVGILRTSYLFAVWVLIFGSCFSGLVFFSIMIGFGSSFFASSIYISGVNLIIDLEYLSIFLKNLPLVTCLFSGFFVFFFNYSLFSFYKNLKYKDLIIWYNSFLFSLLFWFYIKIKFFLTHKWFIDSLGINYFGFFFFKHSYETYYKLLDKGFLEIFFFNGISISILRLSSKILLHQNGFLYSLFCLNLLSFLFFCLLLLVF